MRIFRFDPVVDGADDQFGGVKAIISRIVSLDDRTAINAVYIHPNESIRQQQVMLQRLFLLVEGKGWIKNESDKKYALQEGQAVFLEKAELHEAGTESGVTAVIIEGENIDPAKLIPYLQEVKS